MPRLLLAVLLLSLLGCAAPGSPAIAQTQPHPQTQPAAKAQTQPAPYQALTSLWSLPIPEKTHTGPYASFKDNLYITFQDGKRELRKVRLSDGQPFWSHDFGYNQRIAQPASNGQIVVYGQMTPQFLLVALDDATGQRLWVFAAGGPIYNQPTITGSTVLITAGDDHLYAINAANGLPRWKTAVVKCKQFPPLVWGSDAIVSTLDGNIRAFDITTGQPTWSLDLMGDIQPSPVLHDNTLSMLIRPRDSQGTHLASLDLTNRSVRTTPTPLPISHARLFASDRIIYAFSHNNLIALNPLTPPINIHPPNIAPAVGIPPAAGGGGADMHPPKTGVLWQYPAASARPIFTRGQILLPLNTGTSPPTPAVHNLIALDQRTGTLILQNNTSGLYRAKPLYNTLQINDTVVLDDDTTIQAFKINLADQSAAIAPSPQAPASSEIFALDGSTEPWSKTVEDICARASIIPENRAGKATRLHAVITFRNLTGGSRMIPWASAWTALRVVDDQGATLEPTKTLKFSGPPVSRNDFTLIPNSQTSIDLTVTGHGIPSTTSLYLPCTDTHYWSIPTSPDKTYYLIISLGALPLDRKTDPDRSFWSGRLDLPPILIPTR